MTAWQTQVLFEVGALERENRVTLGNGDHAWVFRPVLTHPKCTIDYQPAIAAAPVPAAHHDFQSAARLVERLTCIQEVTEWMSGVAIG
jgi:hypothetical protein